MILARTSKAARRMSAAFRERRVTKEYWAVVEGRLSGGGVMEDHLVKSRGIVSVTEDTERGRYACLRWAALAHIPGRTVVHIDLITGRPHQIRCQFTHRGFPVLGDLRYGATHSLPTSGVALHCGRLTLEHPVRAEKVTIVAPLPSFWQSIAPGVWVET